MGLRSRALATRTFGRDRPVIIALVVVVVIVTLMIAFGLAIATLPFALLLGTVSVAPPGQVPAIAVVAPAGPLLSDSSDLAAEIQPWMGSRYVFGGNIIGAVDCSGFTLAIERQRGYQLPRTAQGQYNVTERIAPDQAQPNDLVFFAGTYDSRPDFISHVGIYLGDGMMVSAIEPTLGRQDLNTPYWRSHFVGFGRLRR